MRVACAVSMALLAGCTAGYAPISPAEYRLLMESPDNVSVERNGEWTLVTVAEPWQCVHSHRGSLDTHSLIYKVVGRYRIPTSDIEGEEAVSRRPGEEAPRGDY